MLRDHGIAILPDDTDNSIIHSALQSGRKLILSDAGKMILNYPNATNIKNGTPDQMLQNMIRATDAGPIKRKAIMVGPAMVSPGKGAALKTNKVIKLLSAEEFNKMCGNKGANNATTFKKLVNDNSSSAQNTNVR